MSGQFSFSHEAVKQIKRKEKTKGSVRSKTSFSSFWFACLSVSLCVLQCEALASSTSFALVSFASKELGKRGG